MKGSPGVEIGNLEPTIQRMLRSHCQRHRRTLKRLCVTCLLPRRNWFVPTARRHYSRSVLPWMSARRHILVAAAILLLGAGLGLYAWKARGLTYHGRTTEQWFREFRAAEARHLRTNSMSWIVLPNGAFAVSQAASPGRAPSAGPLGFPRSVGVRVPGWPPVGRMPMGPLTLLWNVDVQALLKDPAADGLRALGTNAVPYLVEQFSRKDSRWTLTYSDLYYRKFPPRLRSIAPRPPTPRALIRLEAAWALSALGSNALPAVPALLESLKGASSSIIGPSTILEILGKLPFEPRETDPVLDDLCRQNRLSEAMEVVRNLGLHTPGPPGSCSAPWPRRMLPCVYRQLPCWRYGPSRPH